MKNMEIILSIKPEWADLIYSGRKKIEWRKTRPLSWLPLYVYLYETAPIKKITGYFFCKEILKIHTNEAILFNKNREGCISSDDLMKYIGNNPYIYAWEVSDFVIFDRPMELKEFYSKGSPVLRSPQSWQYCEY